MTHYQYPTKSRYPDGNPSLFPVAMVSIEKRQCKGIAKNSRCLSKSYSMFSEILLSFRRIPFEIILHRLPQWNIHLSEYQ